MTEPIAVQETVTPPDRLMSLEEFCSWARGHPFLPGTDQKDNLRLGWNGTIESAMRHAVYLALSKMAKRNEDAVQTWRKPVAIWLRIVMRVMMADSGVRHLKMELGKLSPESMKALTAKPMQPKLPTGDGVIVPFSSFRRPVSMRERMAAIAAKVARG